MTKSTLAVAAAILWVGLAGGADKLSALIVDGQNNHDWRKTTPELKSALEGSGRFAVSVATSPPSAAGMADFKPAFAKHRVVVSNYNGGDWSPETRQALLDYVSHGGGFVVVHAANNSFGNWREYNEMIGLGGWGGRDERSGPYLYFKDDKPFRDDRKGGGGSHGKQHPFLVAIRDADHPVTRGMPPVWLHAQDELYDRLRGPAKNVQVLATSYSDPKQGGAGRHEPMIFTVAYGKGRVFHTPMGHADYSMRCVGFIATLQRGAEWAATGEVTIPLPKDFPTADKGSSRSKSK